MALQTIQDVVTFIKDEDVRFVDVRFTDVPGTENHFTIPASAVLHPFRIEKTLTITFFVHDPLTPEPFSRDPRNVARRAEEYLASTGIADEAAGGLTFSLCAVMLFPL